jgi:hypothetical protein
MAEFVAALRAGVAYTNVHTNLSPGGEIRARSAPGITTTIEAAAGRPLIGHAAGHRRPPACSIRMRA